MSVTAKNPLAKVRFEVTATGAWWPIIPTPIIVMNTAAMIDAKETTLRYAIPFSVRGNVMTMQMIADTTPQRTEHDAPLVTAKKSNPLAYTQRQFY